LREASESPNHQECCSVYLSQAVSTKPLLAGKHNAHSQSQHKYVAFQSQSTWEKQQEGPQF
jgi:hypothetical protein